MSNNVQQSTKDAMYVLTRYILRRQYIEADVQQLEVVDSFALVLGQAVAMIVVKLTFDVVHHAEGDELSDMFEHKSSTHDVYTGKTMAMKRDTKSGR
ncbi:hypothetical protein DPMN_009377 [Dreissena polymorpha]|uniref:Uncharacterized protein n=1 Tax=Dreissena polymorpha TaxID=45954 RepID=A0A9D4N132_DREPO|nr:hypothetical protein DPMN_009377 [Dreissena polymorpha]